MMMPMGGAMDAMHYPPPSMGDPASAAAGMMAPHQGLNVGSHEDSFGAAGGGGGTMSYVTPLLHTPNHSFVHPP